MLQVRSLIMAAVLGLSCLPACASPVQDDEIASWGGEVSGVPPSEFHRPGQPCVLCHGKYNGEGPIMSVGGTIFATPTTARPVEGAVVTLTDSDGQVVSKTTNCIGNFYFTEDEFVPVFPLRAEISCPVPGTDGERRLVMGTRIGRDGSCASCHVGAPGLDSPGLVYCVESGADAYTVNPNCQGIAPQ